MTGIFMIGAGGRMGEAIYEACAASDGIEWRGGLDVQANPARGIVDGLDALPPGVDVVIDFSLPGALDDTLRLVSGAKANQEIALVVGTTGFSPEQADAIMRFSEHVPVLIAPNMSMGVNILFRLAADLARMAGPDYDIEIIEMHHNKKRDAPSGTARRLLEVVAAERDVTIEVPGREGDTGARKPEEIGVHAIRGGDIFGEHHLIVAGNNERIELVHRAGSRQTFASGALRAATWLSTRAPGLYEMDDVLRG
jgi:4-hydroxy-tetrahydrodipicolinate reductase